MLSPFELWIKTLFLVLWFGRMVLIIWSSSFYLFSHPVSVKCREWIDNGKKWYKGVHIKNDIKVQYIFTISFRKYNFLHSNSLITLTRDIQIHPLKNFLIGQQIKISEIYFFRPHAIKNCKYLRLYLCNHVSTKYHASLQKMFSGF